MTGLNDFLHAKLNIAHKCTECMTLLNTTAAFKLVRKRQCTVAINYFLTFFLGRQCNDRIRLLSKNAVSGLTVSYPQDDGREYRLISEDLYGDACT